jgi:hypothetical protein
MAVMPLTTPQAFTACAPIGQCQAVLDHNVSNDASLAKLRQLLG